MTLIIFIIVFSTLIIVHELGHFMMAKRAGVHIYEFAIGFGPKIWSKVGKDKIVYSIRMFPVGGFVQMAGEVYDDDNKIPKDKLMCNKSWLSRLSIMVAGVVNNFILAFILLFIYALVWGYTETKPIIGTVLENYPAEKAGIEAGDRVLSVNGKKVDSFNMLSLRINMKSKNDTYSILVKKEDGREVTYNVKPVKEKNDKGEEISVFGITSSSKQYKGFNNAIKYSFVQFSSVIKSMLVIIKGLFTGELSIKNLTGPIGIYSVVGQAAKVGLGSVIYLTAFLSINLGFMNILPFPAFDGGRVLFLLIEKIIGRPVNSKFENALHSIFLILLMGLMLYIAIQDVIKLF